MIDTVQVRPAAPGETLVHPSGAIATAAGASWPADQYTFRRLGDGSLVLVDPDEPSPHDTPVLATDILASHRLSFRITDLDAFLASPGSTIGDRIAEQVDSGDIASAIAALKGGAEADHDTLGKLATLITAAQVALTGKATPADITAALAQIVGAAPTTLNTLVEIDNALNNDPNFASTVMTALAGKQPLDVDLTAIAALTTQAFGRSLLTKADAAAVRTLLGLASGSGVQTFNGRDGAVVPASGDYAVGDITGLQTALNSKGTGNVTGPAAATNNDIATFNADGSIKDSGVKIGTAANNALQLDNGGKIPAVDGSQLINLPNAAFFKYTAYTAGGTFTPDARTKSVFVECIGAGGSGAAATTGSAGGGCGGQYNRGYFTAASVGASQAVLVGSGGTSVSGSGIIGNPGGNSSFGSLLKAFGGSGGSLDSNFSILVNPSSGANRSSANPNIGVEFGVGAPSSGIVPGGSTTSGGAGGGGVSANIGGLSQNHGNGGAGSVSGAGTAGSVPGGGGGNGFNGALSGAGARGEVRVWEFG